MFVARGDSKNRLRGGLLALLVALCLGAGCARPQPAAQPAELRQFTDGLGRRVAVAAVPRRIISLAPSTTEILFALEAGERVVGVTSYCDFPAAAQAKEKIGDTLHPNLERMIALKPELIVVTTASQLEQLARQLDQLQIPLYVTNPRTVREVVASIRALGEVIGATPRATELADEMERRIGAVELRVRDLPEPRVLYALQAAPLITAGHNTFINDLINLAGGASISSAEEADYPQFSRETVVARAPEVIIAPAIHGTELVREEDLRRDFAVTPALRNNRIVRVNPDWIRPGPRIVDGLEELAQGLHPNK